MAIDGIPGKQIFRQRDVRRTATASVTVAQQLSPIGSIVAWAKTLTGVPALPTGWVQCDGQVLSDVDSSLKGTTIPDLNGDNQFMRGNSTSGGTGGSETMAHTHGLDILNNGVTTGASPKVRSAITDGASNTENRPPFYNVVWIMRIK